MCKKLVLYSCLLSSQVKVKTKAEKTDLAAGSDEMWSPTQQKALEKALKQNPKGTDQRWDKIARAVPDKTKVNVSLRQYLELFIFLHRFSIWSERVQQSTVQYFVFAEDTLRF